MAEELPGCFISTKPGICILWLVDVLLSHVIAHCTPKLAAYSNNNDLLSQSFCEPGIRKQLSWAALAYGISWVCSYDVSWVYSLDWGRRTSLKVYHSYGWQVAGEFCSCGPLCEAAWMSAVTSTLPIMSDLREKARQKLQCLLWLSLQSHTSSSLEITNLMTQVIPITVEERLHRYTNQE